MDAIGECYVRGGKKNNELIEVRGREWCQQREHP